MNEPGEYSFEIGTMRHAPKLRGDFVGASIDVEKSREGAEAAARALLASLEASPPGTVMALQPSNIQRTDETRSLVVSYLKELVGNRSDITVLELGKDAASFQDALDSITGQPERRVIIADVRATELLGFDPQSENVAAIDALHERLQLKQGFEDAVGKIWASHPAEREQVAESLRSQGVDIQAAEIDPTALAEPPERVALRQIRWMRAMEHIGQMRFPGRPLKLEAISHNLRADFTILALLGEDISATNVDKILGGSFRAPFERSSVSIEGDRVTVRFRDREKQYTNEEFEQLVQSLNQRAKERLAEWGR